jgi:pimeloyl-ACP methyl ester carboxylesterase
MGSSDPGTVPSLSVVSEARGRVDAGGLRMAWAMWPGRGPAVIGLHGITASYMNFVGVAAMLRGRAALLAFDLRGRGDTDKPDTGHFGMAQHAADVAAAMTEFGLGPSVVVGHSMGAFVAAALAAEHPDLVSGVVLVDGGLPLEAPSGVAREELLDVALAAQMARLRTTFDGIESYLDYWRSLPVFANGLWNGWVERYLTYDLGGEAPSMRPKASEAAVRGDFADLLEADRLRGWLTQVKVPVLLLRATEGFEPGSPALLPDALVQREGSLVADLTDRVIDATHYSIALSPGGAGAVADGIIEWTRRCA